MSEKQFEGKSAIVTGGTRGIGKAIVSELAKRGANVAFNYSKSANEAEKLKTEIENSGVKAFAAQCDVADSESVSRICQTGCRWNSGRLIFWSTTPESRAIL